MTQTAPGVASSSSRSTKTVNVGIIGCGARTRYVIQNVLKEAPADTIRVTGLCDPDERSIETAREVLKAPGAKIYPDAAALVADPSISWVVVGSWNKHHAEHAVAALRAGKHVFCEKPLATSLADCLAIRDAVRESNRMFSFGLVLRYSPHYRKIHELVHQGAIGRLVSMEFNETLHFNHGGFIAGDWRRLRENAGTHLLEKCCHDFDIVNWVLDSVPVRAASFGGLSFFRPENRAMVEKVGRGPGGEQPFTWSTNPDANPFTADKTIIDNQVAILEYANGVRATFHTNLCAGLPERRIYLVGTEGALRADSRSNTIELQRVGWDAKIEQHGGLSNDGHAGGDKVLAESIVRSMLTGAEPLVGVEEAMRSAIACFGVDQAQDEQTIIDLRPLWQQAGIAVG